MSDFTFKQVDKNKYETFMEGKSLNIFFKIPEGNKIEAFMMRNIKNFSRALEEKKLAENKDQNNKITTKWEPL